MFVRVSTPEGSTSITVEQLAQAMADERFANQGSKCEQMITMLVNLRKAGVMSDSYYADFVDIATRISKYARVTPVKSPYYPSDPDERKARRAELKRRVDATYAEVYHGEEPRYAS
jgi:hypothetical protein